MKHRALLFAVLFTLTANCQIVNKQYQQTSNIRKQCGQDDIIATENNISITTKVIYNAIPDGYHVTYTKSFIGKSVADVETQMNAVINNLIKDLQSMDITKKDVVVDIISLDPVFNVSLNESNESAPMGYKVTENITFNIKSISTMGALAKKCLDFGIFDLISAEAYLVDSKIIYDSLYNKSVELLEMKKKLCTQIGWAFSGGITTFNKNKDVIYPSERYLSSYASNANLYQHHIAENTAIKLDRTLELDNYFNYNLKDADFVFHGDKTVPVIQFYYQLDYVYTKKPSEAEAKAKAAKEDAQKPEKIFYILDKTGNLKKIEM
jgi:uncharacterized protein YggE